VCVKICRVCERGAPSALLTVVPLSGPSCFWRLLLPRCAVQSVPSLLACGARFRSLLGSTVVDCGSDVSCVVVVSLLVSSCLEALPSIAKRRGAQRKDWRWMQAVQRGAGGAERSFRGELCVETASRFPKGCRSTASGLFLGSGCSHDVCNKGSPLSVGRRRCCRRVGSPRLCSQTVLLVRRLAFTACPVLGSSSRMPPMSSLTGRRFVQVHVNRDTYP
jgi:hypothetical protein